MKQSKKHKVPPMPPPRRHVEAEPRRVSKGEKISGESDVKRESAGSDARWSVKQAAEMFGSSSATIKKRMIEAGHELRDDAPNFFLIKDFIDAMMSNPRLATARLAEARTQQILREEREAAGETIPLEQNLAWQEKTLMSIRQRIVSLPSSMALRTNPSDPEHSLKALNEWVAESLPFLRNDLTQHLVDRELMEKLTVVIEEHRAQREEEIRAAAAKLKTEGDE